MPTPGLPYIPQPITGLPLVAAELPIIPALAIVGSGLQLPAPQLASFTSPVAQTVEEKPVIPSRPAVHAPKPVVPVRPPKQARH